MAIRQDGQLPEVGEAAENGNRSTASLSKREWMAATIASGLAGREGYSSEGIASDALRITDRLLLGLAR